MKREVVLLKYIDYNTDDIFNLGFFRKEKLKETVDFYRTLSGFSNGAGKFFYDHSLFIEGNSAFLLQIFNRYDDSIIYYQHAYEAKNDAQNGLESFIGSNREQDYDFVIDCYDIDKKEWSEGFITLVESE